MNKIYKVIWSKTRNCYVAVSEIAKRNGKDRTSVNCGTKSGQAARVLCALLLGAYLTVGYSMPVAWGANKIVNTVGATSQAETYSFWGVETDADTEGSTAWGYKTKAGEFISSGTTYTGKYATAWGNSTRAVADYATAWGSGNISRGHASTAFGYSTQAIGGQATAFGFSTLAKGGMPLPGVRLRMLILMVLQLGVTPP